jgi:nucleotide-binding universal stress UspA family protein
VFNEEAAQRLTDARWFESDGEVVHGICDSARYVDLVILGQYEWQGPHVNHPLPIAHSVVLRCGRPVVVVPAAVGPISFARVAIAWDGSREAVRAVHDALPLLALSQSVEIVTVIPPSAVESDDDAKHLSAHLANHGIKIEAGVIQIRAEEEPIAPRKQMEKAQYDLLVMGADALLPSAARRFPQTRRDVLQPRHLDLQLRLATVCMTMENLHYHTRPIEYLRTGCALKVAGLAGLYWICRNVISVVHAKSSSNPI